MLHKLLQLFYHNAENISPSVRETLRLEDLSANAEVGNESFPSCLESVASAFGDLRARLNNFREYTVCDRPILPALWVQSFLPG
jgi:hypothetical protein